MTHAFTIAALSDLLALAERCEQATGPDRELDGEIAAAAGARFGPDSGWCDKENGDYWTTDQCAKDYTASIDAAMTLVPEGMIAMVVNSSVDLPTPDLTRASAVVGYANDPDNDPAEAATMALALCAAALRARANQEKING